MVGWNWGVSFNQMGDMAKENLIKYSLSGEVFPAGRDGVYGARASHIQIGHGQIPEFDYRG